MFTEEKLHELIKTYFPFKEFRSEQFEIITRISKSFIFNNNNRFILEAPTGTGKSVIAYTVAAVLKKYYEMYDEEYFSGKKKNGPEIIICTSTKALQKQYESSFKNTKLIIKSIWSSKNYKCCNPKFKDDEVYYGESICLGKKCNYIHICEYAQELKEFNRADIGICNYHYFLHKITLKPNIVIFDETHNLQNILCEYNSLVLSKKSLLQIINILNKYSTTVDIKTSEIINPFKKIFNFTLEELENEKFKEYAQTLHLKLKQIYSKLILEFNELNDETENILRDEGEDSFIIHQLKNLGRTIDRIKNIKTKLKTFINSDVRWVISELDSKYLKITIKPLDVSESMNILEKEKRHLIFMSATICGFQQFIQELGVEGNIDYLETKCLFPIENRKIYNLKTASLNYKNKKEVLPILIKEIDKIIKWMTDDWNNPMNGIIHTVSYDNVEFIKEYSEYSHLLFTPDKEDILDLNKIIQNKSPVIISSPSVLEGVDLIGNLSRFQIFIKVPYAHLGDRWVNFKRQADPIWYARDAIIKIVQGSGRSVRSIDDWAWTFILDNNFNTLLYKNNNLFPIWFKQAII